MKKVEVVWRDSKSWSGWAKTEKMIDVSTTESLVCSSVGYIVAENEERLVLAQNVAFDGDEDPQVSSMSELIAIPQASVMEIKKLRQS